MWCDEEQSMCTRAKVAKWDVSDIMFHLTGFICLSVHHCGPYIPKPIQDFFLKKLFLFTFLVQVAKFSTMSHEKQDLQVLKKAKTES